MAFSIGRWRQFTRTYANAPLVTSDIDPPHRPEFLDTDPREALSPRRIRLNICIAVAVFVVAALVALFPDNFDRPVVQSLNQLVGQSKLFDRIMLSVFWYPTYSGVMVMAVIWSRWFATDTVESRCRIMIGILAAFCAGTISRWLQHILPTHPRPYYDHAVSFRMPSELEQQLNTWNSFPSDHGTIFGALVVLIYIARFKYALQLAILVALIELARTYVGAHYPSDLIGGAALGTIAIWVVQKPRIFSLCSPALQWEKRSPSIFYAVAFFLSYQVATLFGDLRWTAGLILRP